MDWILNLIPGGGLTAIMAAVVAAILGAWGLFSKIERSGVNKEKAKEAEARDKNLDKIKRAGDAKPVGGVSDDPNNRDNR
jgi:hypothetical protein